jgi:protein-disulfide isomerase
MAKRSEAKQSARVVRELKAKEARRQRAMWISLIAVVLLVLAGLIGWSVLRGQQSKTVNTPAHATAGGAGLVAAGSGPATVEVYLDYICPHCKEFETTVGPTLNQLVDQKKITLVQHPLGFLDEASSTRFSTRAAAAAGCASDGGKLSEYTTAMYAQQPAEGSAGLSDDQIVAIGRSVGLGDDFATCVHDGRYLTWVAKVNDAAAQRGVNATPTVYVNGTATPATADAITKAVG